MSLLSRIANKEIVDFLRTTTLKCTYFADKSKSSINESYLEQTPEIETPYIRHLAGEYILAKPITGSDDPRHLVTDPMTGMVTEQVYPNPETPTQLYNADRDVYIQIADKKLYRNDFKFDEMMYVTSLDTGEEIPFTLENLHGEFAKARGWSEHSVHTKTLSAYKVPGRYFDLLCERYPNQVDLIKAIVYPTPAREYTAQELATIAAIESGKRIAADGTEISIDDDLIAIMKASLPSLSRRRREKIVAAKNFDILSYDDSLLEENERIEMVMHMKTFLDVVKKRWDIADFCYEDNYPQVLWSVVWSLLPLILVAKRYADIKTPFVHSTHLWDYLTSNGLEEYKGYLNTTQALFLYKNITYLKKHRGKQLVMNILIDNLLNEFNLDITAKTVVLDTSLTLKDPYTPSSPILQCSQCSRRSTCKKGITTHICPDFLGLDYLCKAEPVVLTEQFAGASKSKILKALVKQYGYTEEQALEKYNRSFLWRDAIVEEIRSRCDRDQLVDVSGGTEKFEDTFAREHKGGLEPISNTEIIEDQERTLAHIAGTYAPTKLLELTEKIGDVQYADLFTKFFTDTLLRFAPKAVNGNLVRKVNDSYKFTVKDNTNSYILGFGEMLAALYLGMTMEDYIDFSRTRNYEQVTDENHQWSLGYTYNPDTTYYFKDSVQNYHILQEDDRLNNIHHPWYIHPSNDLLTNQEGVVIDSRAQAMLANDNGQTFNFPIPSKARINTSFKYGKPVKQEDLVTAYGDSSEYAGDEVTNLDTMSRGKAKICTINGTKYVLVPSANTKAGTPENPDIWFDVDPKSLSYEEGHWISTKKAWLTPMTILGEFLQSGIYMENNGEIPIIPTYFKWRCNHLSFADTTDDNEDGKADKDGTSKVTLRRNIIKRPSNPQVTVGNITVTVKDCVSAVDEVIDLGVEPLHDSTTWKEDIYVSHQGKDKFYYQKLRVDQYVDVNEIIDTYIDVMGTVGRQDSVARYITTMFTLLKRLTTLHDGSVSIRSQEAIQAVLDSLLISKKIIEFDLTSTEKTSTYKSVKETKVPYKSIPVATYTDWMNDDEDLDLAIKAIVAGTNQSSIWNEFNSTIISRLMEGIDLNYAKTKTDSNRYNKLKELVMSLSSYKITVIDRTQGSDGSISSPQTLNDVAETEHEVASVFHFDPIIVSTACNHLTTHLGEVGAYVPTRDRLIQNGKTYYVRKSRIVKERTNTVSIQDVRHNWCKVDITAAKTAAYAELMTEFTFFNAPFGKRITQEDLDGGYHTFLPPLQDDISEFVPVDTSENSELHVAYTDQLGNFVPASSIPFGMLYEQVDIGEELGVGSSSEAIKLVFTRVRDGASSRWKYEQAFAYRGIVVRPANLGDPNCDIGEDTFLTHSLITPAVKKKLGAALYTKEIEVVQVARDTAHDDLVYKTGPALRTKWGSNVWNEYDSEGNLLEVHTNEILSGDPPDGIIDGGRNTLGKIAKRLDYTLAGGVQYSAETIDFHPYFLNKDSEE